MNAIIFALLLKVTAILGIAAIAAFALQRASAAWRHYVWSAAMSSVLVLVVLQLVLPPIVVRVDNESAFRALAQRNPSHLANASSGDNTTPPTAVSRPVARTTHSVTAALGDVRTEFTTTPLLGAAPASDVVAIGAHVSSGTEYGETDAQATSSAHETRNPTVEDVRPILLLLWAIGSLLLLIRIARSHWHLNRLVKSARELKTEPLQSEVARIGARLAVNARVRLFVHPTVNTPCTAGWRQPMIMLPANFSKWTSERRLAVFTHEIAHIARGDSVSQTLASVVCALFWFHPGFWLAVRQMRSESERAADDVVIGAGMPAVEYADHLLAIADRASFLNRVPAAAVGMARTTQLETRLRALLNGRQSRRALTPVTRRVFGLTALLSVIPLAGLQARVQEPLAPQTQLPVPSRISPITNATTFSLPMVEAPSKSAAPTSPQPHDVLPTRQPTVATLLLPHPVKTAPTYNEGPWVSAKVNSDQTELPSVAEVASSVAVLRPIATLRSNDSINVGADTVIQTDVPAKSGDALQIHLMSGGNVTVHGWDQPVARLRAHVTGKYWRETRVLFGRSAQGIQLFTIAEVGGTKVSATLSDSQPFGAQIRIVGMSSLAADSLGWSPQDKRRITPRPRVTLENEFELWVPKNVDIKFSSVGGDLTLQGVQGTFSGKTESGTINADTSRGGNYNSPDKVLPTPPKPIPVDLSQLPRKTDRTNVGNQKSLGTNGEVRAAKTDTVIDQTMSVTNDDVFTLYADVTGDVHFHRSANNEVRVRTAIPASFSELHFALDRMKTGPQLTISSTFARKSDAFRLQYDVWLPDNLQLYVAPTGGPATYDFDAFGLKGTRNIQQLSIKGWMDVRCITVAIRHLTADLHGTLTCGVPRYPLAGFVPLKVTVDGEPLTDRIRSTVLGQRTAAPFMKQTIPGSIPYLQISADSAIFGADSMATKVRYTKDGGRVETSPPIQRP